MILILSYPLLILEVLWWVDGENKNLKSHWTGRSFTKKPWQEVSTLYMYICKLSMVFFLVTKTYRNASERQTCQVSWLCCTCEFDDFTTCLRLSQVATDFSCFLEKSNSKRFGALGYQIARSTQRKCLAVTFDYILPPNVQISCFCCFKMAANKTPDKM